MTLREQLSPLFWDLCCLMGIISIWPRFIEPNLLQITTQPLKINSLPDDLAGLRIVQLSDLHIHPRLPDRFLQKISSKVKALQPDLIVLTGDLLCYAEISASDQLRLKKLLNDLHATYGCYVILGNHDYETYLTLNSKGEYDAYKNEKNAFAKGLVRLFSSPLLKKKVTERAEKTPLNSILNNLLQTTHFHLLHNETTFVPIKQSGLNITGLGDYMAGRCLPEVAFANYHNNYPGIVLSHNPDSLPLLKAFPGEIILCGHTHGGQINLPFIRKRLTILEDPTLMKGLFQLHRKQLYINRGLGGPCPFRWFSIPEISLFTLEAS